MNRLFSKVLPLGGVIRGISLILLLAVPVVSFAQKPFKLEGKVEGEKTATKMYVKLADADKADSYFAVDSVEVRNGKFSYSKVLNDICPALIYSGEKNQTDGAMVFFVPGETLKLTIRGEEFFYDGSDIYKSCDVADKALTPLNKDLMTYYEAAVARLQTMTEEQAEAATEGIRDTINAKSEAYNNAQKTYLDTHLNDEGALLYLLYQVDPEDVYSRMGDDMKNSRIGRLYKARMKAIAELRAKEEKEAAEEQARIDAKNGTPAPDFTLTDIKGKQLSLSSLRGKYVVLDFWGSWCGWCIKGIPDMKKYYEKYAGKFEILGVDCNDSDAAWRNAVEKHGLPWLHVYNPKNSSVLGDYGVRGFPTKIVVDPQGNIIKTIVGEDPAFYEYLDELFK